MRELSCGCRSEKACVKGACDCQSIKTHHYIICFVRALHSKPGMESFCWSSTDQLSWQAYGAIISQVWSSCWLWGILMMVGCVWGQLKPSELYILSCGIGLGSEGFILYITYHAPHAYCKCTRCVKQSILCGQIRFRRWWRWWRGRWNRLTFHHLSSLLGETLAYLVFFSIVSNFNFRCFCNIYLATIRYVLCL